MTLSKDHWMEEEEAICEQYTDGSIEELEARQRFKKLGLDPDEINDYIDVLDDDRHGVEPVDKLLAVEVN